MTYERPPVIIEQYLVRTIMVLSAAAGRAESVAMRNDLEDSAAMLMRLAMEHATDNMLRDWCERTMTVLDSGADTDAQSISSARLAVMRLRSSLPPREHKVVVAAVTPKAKPPVQAPVNTKNEPNRSRIIISEFIGSRPNVRMRDLVSGLKSSLSERTIKRCLKDMVAGGTVRRADNGGIVVYSVAGGAESLD